jgi:TolB-like protein
MSPDPEQTYFCDGMVEDIITELSRSRSLMVILRAASFMYRDIRQIAAELGVRYLLEGSARANASRVRFNAQLIDAENGGHVWAERYDREIVDMFSVQDEITHAVAMAIEPAVHDSEQIRANRVLPENLGAWEAFHRGMWLLDRMDPESNATARAFFQQAIALDPGFAPPPKNQPPKGSVGFSYFPRYARTRDTLEMENPTQPYIEGDYRLAIHYPATTRSRMSGLIPCEPLA